MPALDLTPALPGHYATADGQQRPPISRAARFSVRVADAAIVRAMYRAYAHALRPWNKHDAPFCTGENAALYDALPGLPRWPNVSPPYV